MEQWIKLQGLTLDVSVGVHDFEKSAPQPYRVDISLRIAYGYIVVDDSISEAVDYDQLRNEVSIKLRSQHFNTQEFLIQIVMGIAFGLDSRVVEVDVDVCKPSVYQDCEGVGLRYRSTRIDWSRVTSEKGFR